MPDIPQAKTSDNIGLSSCCSDLFEVRLSSSEEDVIKAQKLRYNVFYEEGNAQPTAQSALYKRELDAYDWQAEHLLIIEKTSKQLVACYRMMRRSQLPSGMKFYSQSEFDLNKVLQHPLATNCVELSRACVAKKFRASLIPNLLLKALGIYTSYHKFGLLFGCGSLPGTDPKALAAPLSWMYHNYLAPQDLCATPLPHLFQRMDLIEKKDLNFKQANTAMPPLIKGYLRMGCNVGNGAVIDQQFKTTDIFITLAMDKEAGQQRYIQRYLAESSETIDKKT